MPADIKAHLAGVLGPGLRHQGQEYTDLAGAVLRGDCQENLGLFPFRVRRVGELRVVGVIGDGGNPFGKLYHSLQ